MSQPRAEVFMFEYWLNLAVSSLLITGGLKQAIKQGDSTLIETPAFSIKSTFNGWWGQTSLAPHQWINQSTGEKFPDTTDAKLYVKIETNRGDDKQDHARLVGTVRGLLMTGRTAINGKLPWHTLCHLQETASVPDFAQSTNYEVATLSFDARLRILFDSKTADIFNS